MKTIATTLALATMLFTGSAISYAQSAKEDMKEAGHSAGHAAKKTGEGVEETAKDAGHVAKKTGKKVKHGTKKVVNKGADATGKAADKVEDKTR